MNIFSKRSTVEEIKNCEKRYSMFRNKFTFSLLHDIVNTDC